ncbi:MAG: sporulation membrane protein YtaF [Peptococcaceae bacterium]|nr:sporulation membrane protein YtaF [Peptococcaceae bacterium]
MATLVLALIVSLDGLIAGSTLGLRKVKIPVSLVCLVGLTSACVMYVSMSLGEALRRATVAGLAENIGASLLVMLGLLLLFPPKKNDKAPSGQWGLKVVEVWRDPLLADHDHSGEISIREAIVLGLALALDSLGAGVGAGMAGLAPVMSSLYVGVSKIVALSIGISFGAKLSQVVSEKVLTMLPGVMLIVLGCWRMAR